MAFVAVAAIGAAATVYSAHEQRESAKEQASQAKAQAEKAALQAAESARGNALAAQAASERENALRKVEDSAKQAALDLKAPDVEIAAVADPAEAERRRTVRAQFSLDEQPGSIRL